MSTTALSSQIECLPDLTRAATGFTHRVRLDTTHLNETAVATSDIFTFAIPALTSISDVMLTVEETLQDVSDAGFNSNTVSVGDNSSATTFLGATETNANGSYVKMARMQTQTTGPQVYTAANTLKITVNSMAAKALNDLDRGKISVWLKMFTMP